MILYSLSLTHTQIGGSLAKLVYFSREPHSKDPGGRLNFVKFETDRITNCIEFMYRLQKKHKQLNGGATEDLCVMATGGGAFKYYEDIRKRLGVEVLREDEMECLIIGNRRFRYSNRANVISRARFLHSRDPERSIHPFGQRASCFSSPAYGDLSISTRKHRLRSIYDQGQLAARL